MVNYEPCISIANFHKEFYDSAKFHYRPPTDGQHREMESAIAAVDFYLLDDYEGHIDLVPQQRLCTFVSTVNYIKI